MKRIISLFVSVIRVRAYCSCLPQHRQALLIAHCLLLILTSPLFLSAVLTAQAGAVEVAPRISDKEIVEKLTRLEEGQNKLQQQIVDTNRRIEELKDSTNKKIDDLKESNQRQMNDLKESTNKQFDGVNRQFDGVNRQFDGVNRQIEGVNKRLDTLQWLLGLFTTVALSVMVIMGRVLWNQQKKLTQIETSLEAQKEEISFLKTLIEKLQTLIEKLLPPRGVL